MRQVSSTLRRRIAAGAAMALMASLLAGTASGRERNHSDDTGAMVDHDGIYLAQQIGQCLNHSGPCYFGGQCPGGESTHYAYATGRVYCENFYPPRPYAPTFFESLIGAR
jgi:hypothetical protein